MMAAVAHGKLVAVSEAAACADSHLPAIEWDDAVARISGQGWAMIPDVFDGPSRRPVG